MWTCGCLTDVFQGDAQQKSSRGGHGPGGVCPHQARQRLFRQQVTECDRLHNTLGQSLRRDYMAPLRTDIHHKKVWGALVVSVSVEVK